MTVEDFFNSFVNAIPLGMGIGMGTAIGTYLGTKQLIQLYEKTIQLVLKKLNEAKNGEKD